MKQYHYKNKYNIEISDKHWGSSLKIFDQWETYIPVQDINFY